MAYEEGPYKAHDCHAVMGARAAGRRLPKLTPAGGDACPTAKRAYLPGVPAGALARVTKTIL